MSFDRKPVAISGPPTFVKLFCTVTRELRSDAAGSESVERLIAATGGGSGLVPSGTELIPVKRSWNSEHG